MTRHMTRHMARRMARHMARLDLRREARDHRIALGDQPELSERDRAVAIATWRGRMVNEHISARVFAALIPQMEAAAIDGERRAAIARMRDDELRHGRICAAAVVALGGEPVAELGPLAAVPDHAEVAPVEALLRNVISISCLSETVAVALIGAERLATGPAPLRAALREILADEVGHARFGWRLLEELGPRLTPRLREALGLYLVTAFTHLREHELAHLPPRPSPSPAAESVGVCDGRDARALFFDTVRAVIIPGLERHGIPAGDAWRASLTA